MVPPPEHTSLVPVENAWIFPSTGVKTAPLTTLRHSLAHTRDQTLTEKLDGDSVQ